MSHSGGNYLPADGTVCLQSRSLTFGMTGKRECLVARNTTLSPASTYRFELSLGIESEGETLDELNSVFSGLSTFREKSSR